jgi:MFS transporter, DHA1 family, tetracycline resistance protein
MKKNTLLLTFFVVFMDLVGFGIIIPVLPLLLVIKNFGSIPNSSYVLPMDFSQQNGYILYGFLLAVYALGQFLATPILGQFSDKFGRKPVLAYSLMGTCISYIIFAYGIITKDLGILFISRFFDGITGGNISVAQAIVADISTPENRAKNFGMIGAAFSLGFILGPYIGGKLSDPTVVSWFNASVPFWFAAILSFASVLFVIFRLPETNQHIDINKKIIWSQCVNNIIAATRLKSIKIQLFTNFLYQGGFSFFTAFAGSFFYQKFLFTPGNLGDFYAYIGFWVALAQALITGRLAKKFPESTILKFSYIGTSIGVLAHLLVPTLTSDNFIIRNLPLFILVPFFATAIGLSQANSQALISKSVSPQLQGQILGINSSVQALAQAIPALLSGFIAASFEGKGDNAILPPSAYPLIISSITIFCAWLFFVNFYKKGINTKTSVTSITAQ